MYAIVDIAGQQFKVKKDQKIFVHRLEGKEGSKVDFDKVLLVDNDGKITVGEPLVKNIVVSASIVSHLKGDKVKVFKKKRRKGYKVLNGHRQFLTEIHIDDIGAGKAKTKTEPKTEAAKKTSPEKEVKADAKTTSKTGTKETSKKLSDTKTKAAPKTKTDSKETTKAKSTPKKTASDTKKSVSKPKVKAETKKAPAKKPAATKAAPKTKTEKDK